MLYIHIHLYTIYTQYIYIYTQYFTFIYGLSSKGLGSFLIHQASQSFVREGALFFTDCRLDAYSRQFLCCFILTLHISIRGVFGNGNNYTSQKSRHKVYVASYLLKLSSLAYENSRTSTHFLYTNTPIARLVQLYCFLFLIDTSIVKSNKVLNLKYTGGHNRKSRTDSNPHTFKLSFSRTSDLGSINTCKK